MLPILAMLTSSFVIDVIELSVIAYVGTGAVIDAANIINNKLKQHKKKDRKWQV